MKLRSFNLFVIVASISLISCSQDHSSNDGERADAQEKTSTESGIRLNNGEKWKVNEDMKPYVLEADSILTAFVANDSTDYKTLAIQLKTKNSELINNCTMKGESHNQLHKWLHPHMELVDALNEASTTEKANDVISKLDASFKTFHTYFE